MRSINEDEPLRRVSFQGELQKLPPSSTPSSGSGGSAQQRKRRGRAMSVTSLGLQGDLLSPPSGGEDDAGPMSPWARAPTSTPARGGGRRSSVAVDSSLTGKLEANLSPGDRTSSPRGFGRAHLQLVSACAPHLKANRKVICQHDSSSGVLPAPPSHFSVAQMLQANSDLPRLKLGGSIPMLGCLSDEVLSSASLFSHSHATATATATG
eukprot:CAMPEP_0113913120 /NCGR_PEP_ID=MMETSP0780_2-20120614/29363_1 /TAXON_ID=652834 /ORGANISM="Palpitomonas bilix" /LENGTH=208 /DNA_ID=CAMNT_0000910269 /DNA_START=256 /DNA_END=878 /DNA_ORIENTATION=- /assembly_acc=CAM_ASM_000599